MLRKNRFWSKLFSYGQRIIEGKRRGKAFLIAVSFLWRVVVFSKNWLYDRKIFVPRKVSKPVVSIGNVIVGGTGKTPLALLLATHFSHRKVAILSRGESLQGSLRDEPALLSQRCPLARVYLGKDRRLSAAKAISEGAEVIFLDDGFQHRKLHRDIDVVLVAAKENVFDKKYLPAGYLRDDPRRLEEAAFIFVNPIHSEKELQDWKKTSPIDRPLIGVSLEIKRFVPAVSLRGMPIAFFCGIARPERFRDLLLAQGAEIVIEKILADHEGIDPLELDVFAKKAKVLGAQALLCTQKDFVKLVFREKLALAIIYPEMELKITAGHENWQKLVAKIEEKIDNCGTYGE
ncbi:MAG: tetraacyldisaccharide 4'-kinase [Chlamydiae bacterium]|nr:tetraacyldisaccharide 4'-kinase [Chlamydiota bacterium]